jgi:DHA1 family bicyclomycin/chloramphenicol resistance-like MFS transporter
VPRVAPGTILKLGVGLMLLGGAAILLCTALRIGGVAGIVGPMLVYVVGMALVMPNAIAAAMEPVPHMAGFASSLIGCLQTAGGGMLGYLLGRLYDRSAVPMAVAIAGAAALAGVTYFGFLARAVERRAPQPSG